MQQRAREQRTVVKISTYNNVMVAILNVRDTKKSDYVNRCVLTWRTIGPSFSLIQSETETTEP